MFTKETNILIAEDSINVRQIICDSLRRIGFSNLETASDANEAFAKLVSHTNTKDPIGLILSDLNMPGPSGLDFLRKIRDIETYKNIPFMLITTEGERQAVLQAAMAGVSGYIVKPFNVETLTKRIQEAWKKHNP